MINIIQFFPEENSEMCFSLDYLDIIPRTIGEIMIIHLTPEHYLELDDNNKEMRVVEIGKTIYHLPQHVVSTIRSFKEFKDCKVGNILLQDILCTKSNRVKDTCWWFAIDMEWTE